MAAGLVDFKFACAIKGDYMPEGEKDFKFAGVIKGDYMP